MASPYSCLFHKPPDYLALKTFGCTCFPLIRPYNRFNFQYHSVKCVFVGYCDNSKGYKCLHPSGRVYVSRDVIFNELEFPYPSLFPSKSVRQIPHSSQLMPTLAESTAETTKYIWSTLKAANTDNPAMPTSVNQVPHSTPI